MSGVTVMCSDQCRRCQFGVPSVSLAMPSDAAAADVIHDHEFHQLPQVRHLKFENGRLVAESLTMVIW